MNRNRLIILAVVTLLLGGLVAVLNRGDERAEPASGQALLPGLAEVVNEIDAIDVVAPGGEVIQLRRDATRWRLPQRDGYEADFARVLELLRSLRQAKIVAQKTANPDWYARLGVQDPGADDATGRRIDFPGRDLSSIIVGQVDPTGAGSYVRRAGEAQSWLIDRVLEVPADPVSWLERGIMDIPAEDIAEVVVRHPDGEVVRLRRAETEGSEFVLLDVPEGRSAGPAWRRTALANGLRALNLDDVRRFDGSVPEDATSVLFVTTDGLNFIIELFADEAGHWVHFTVSAEPEPPSEPDPGPETEIEGEPADAAAGTIAEATAQADQAALASLGAGAEELEPADEASAPAGDEAAADPYAERLASAVAVDARLSPWLFKIPKRRYDDLTVRLESLLAPLSDAG